MVYASNSARIRDDLWANLQQLSTQVQQWLILGDFNVVRDISERVSNTTPNLGDIMDFNSCLLHCGVDDLHSTGCEMTWTNKQDIDSIVWSKLDRALANSSWLNTFPGTCVSFLPSGISDHSPVLVNVFEDKHIGSRFSFLNSWVKHPAYHSLVSEAWNELFVLHYERALLAHYIELRNMESSIIKQKAKIDHISYSDSSSKYFFARIQDRKQQQIIGKIIDRNGSRER
ncbi:uncharacterized protein LOC141590228 [Silene latifolia]|uniref:uncharacterized protein LOC141590228 n=1 Tax=Silene latifolia TaxID=37657 RepID=UPI003D777D3B